MPIVFEQNIVQHPLWLTLLWNGGTGIAYSVIPALLWIIFRRRRDLPLSPILPIFSILMLICGLAHLVTIWAVWHPITWLNTAIQSLVTILSVLSAGFLWWLLPTLLSLPSPERLQKANAELEHEVTERQSAEVQLHTLNRELEQRVSDRTSELGKTNTTLSEQISELSRVEEALRENQELLQAIAGSFPAVLTIKDLSGRYLLVNRHFEELFHKPANVALGKTDEELFPKEVADFLKALDQKAFYLKRPLNCEYRTPLVNGGHNYLIMKFPILNSEGRMYAIGGLSTDIFSHQSTED